MLKTTDKCKHCGADYGLHHYATNQCPVGGREAPIGRKQEYKSTVFEQDTTTEIEELREMIKKLTARIEELEEHVETMQAGSEIEESVRIYGTGE